MTGESDTRTRDSRRERSLQQGFLLLILLGFLVVVVVPVTAYSTEVTVRRYATDGLTPVNETTKTYLWMEANLPVYGDGNTYYYFQGPIFEEEWEANYGVTFPEYRTDWGGTPPDWLNSSEMWDRIWNGTAYEQKEETNWQGKNLGKLKGTNIKDLCDLVGGLPEGKRVRVIATDNVDQYLPYSALYEPPSQLGSYVLTWWSVGASESGATNGYTGPDYPTGMRATFFSDTSRNENGDHVAGLGDQAEGLPEDSWYYFGGHYPSMGGWTLKNVDRIYVYGNDPVPLPAAGFMANTRTGHIQNGNFETGILTPWTGSAATVSNTYSYKKDSYSLKLLAPASGSAWIQQTVDLTNIGSINFWRHSFGWDGKYMEVLVDDTVVANYTETTTVPNDYESIDITSYGFTGTHTIRFNAVNTNPSGVFTVYLDNIEDYGPGTSGDAPLTIQFKDLSTKMEDPAHTSWLWDFYNNGTATSTQQNPLFTYTANGTYTVNLTVTNAGGSNTSTRNSYITVGTSGTPTISSITPNSGPTTGNTAITIRGTNFVSGGLFGVKIGGVAATNVSWINATAISARTPAGIVGVRTVVVTNNDGQTATKISGFTYVAPPAISSITPNSGPTTGNTAITIRGTNFVSGGLFGVKIGGVTATNVTRINATTITAKTPAGTAGAKNVVVTNNDGQTATKAGGFTYVAPPTISSITPNSGPTKGSTPITIRGTNFVYGGSFGVKVGGVAATNISRINATTITAKTPAGTTGAKNVVVTNKDGQTATKASGFTYIAPPTISSITPNSGPTKGSTPITVRGTNFVSGGLFGVKIGGVAATNITRINATAISARTPARPAGARTVVVTNKDGQTATKAGGFTYV
jgi:PKD repeat protein